MTQHVIPTNDKKPHIKNECCSCKPSVIIVENGNRIIVHNAFDYRELFEMNPNLNN